MLLYFDRHLFLALQQGMGRGQQVEETGGPRWIASVTT